MYYVSSCFQSSDVNAATILILLYYKITKLKAQNLFNPYPAKPIY